MSQFVVLDGKPIGSLGELRRAIGNKHVIADPLYIEDGRRLLNGFCLCAVDIRKSAKSAGYKCRQDKDDSMAFILTKTA